MLQKNILVLYLIEKSAFAACMGPLNDSFFYFKHSLKECKQT